MTSAESIPIRIPLELISTPPFFIGYVIFSLQVLELHQDDAGLSDRVVVLDLSRPTQSGIIKWTSRLGSETLSMLSESVLLPYTIQVV
jgi:hypothetical protein